MSEHSVLILGAHGRTGSSIVDGLLEDGSFRVIAAVRPSSTSKPEVEALKARGVEIRVVDLENAKPDELDAAVKDIETVISAVVYDQLELQKLLIDASKRVGVKRFIPCDWGTACVPGVRKLYDDKLAIHEYIKKSGVGYTFIDVGWWFQLTLPIVDPSKSPYSISDEEFVNQTRRIYGTGDIKNAVTDLRDVGHFVAKIIQDDRTLNRYVFCWGEEVTQKDVFGLAERISGQKIPVSHWDAEELSKRANGAHGLIQTSLEYIFSNYIRGDNTVENAKKDEYGSALDARELYPNLKVRTLEDWAKEYYA